LLNKEDELESEDLLDGIKEYPWFIETKYYEAAIRVCSLEKKTIADQEFADSVEAVVIHFDSFRVRESASMFHCIRCSYCQLGR